MNDQKINNTTVDSNNLTIITEDNSQTIPNLKIWTVKKIIDGNEEVVGKLIKISNNNKDSSGVTGSDETFFLPKDQYNEFNFSSTENELIERIKKLQEYRLKYSILNQSKQRQAKAGFKKNNNILGAIFDGVSSVISKTSPDNENYGEFIASCVGNKIKDDSCVGNKIKDDFIMPNVSLLYTPPINGNQGTTSIASKYIDDVTCNLNSVGGMTKNSKLRHSVISFTKKTDDSKDGVKKFVKAGNLTAKTQNYFCIGDDDDQSKQMRSDVAMKIATSAFFGDHDLNPGNMVLIKDVNGKYRCGGIDLGHAFDDLISTSAIGGKVYNNKNQILDFINRPTIDNIKKKKRVSKLKLCHEGVVPSKELIAAFKKIGNDENDEKITQGIQEAENSFLSLISYLQSSQPHNNQKEIHHILTSLKTINRLAHQNPINEINTTAEAQVHEVFQNLNKFLLTGRKQMLEVADLMETQMDIDKHIQGEINKHIQDNTIVNVDSIIATIPNDIKTKYSQYLDNDSICNEKKDGICWIKCDIDAEAYNGSLEGYINNRFNQLKIQKEIAIKQNKKKQKQKQNISLLCCKNIDNINLNVKPNTRPKRTNVLYHYNKNDFNKSIAPQHSSTGNDIKI